MSRESPTLDDLYGVGAEAADARAQADVAFAERIAAAVVASVAEIPDCTSPDDEPEMMLVTGDELREHVMRAFEVEWERPPAEAPLATPQDYGLTVYRSQQYADDYVQGYEFRGEDEEGREGFHTPTPEEDVLIRDAINGLIADEDFVTLVGLEFLARQKRRAAEAACLRCGAPSGQHWGLRCSAVETGERK